MSYASLTPFFIFTAIGRNPELSYTRFYLLKKVMQK